MSNDDPCRKKFPPEPTPKKQPEIHSKKSFPKPEELASYIKQNEFLKNLNAYIKNLYNQGSSMADSAKVSGRVMKFPYTYTAKIAQFPFKFYYNNSWLFRYYLIAVAVTAPLFYKIGKASYSPENVRKWDEIRRKEFTPGGHH